MPSKSDESTIENTIERATYRNPFIEGFTHQTDGNEVKVRFSLAEPLDPPQIRKFGERLYDSFRESGLLSNVIFLSHEETELQIRVTYTGQRVQ